MSLKDQVVVITGAGRPNGIGAGIARCFLAEGARVVITDLPGTPLDDTVAALDGAAPDGNVTGIVADASSQASMAEGASAIVASHGRIDVLVNNAGIAGPTPGFEEMVEDEPLLSMTDDAWDNQLSANLRTTFSSTAAVAPHLSDGGSIINIASIAALGPTVSLPAYGAAKAGVVHLTKTTAMQLAPRRIRVNCICPGLLWTRAWDILTERMQAKQPEYANMTQRQVFETIVANITPLGAEQTPEDIGNLAAFYASSKARMITGAVVAVDGGISID